jgi:2-polyprenyl-3-methyl-5-hydroxy-6-metoxy-1,4-benzoquinol methylase
LSEDNILQHRSQEKELLDLGSDYYTSEEYEHCMKMLFRVNKIFGFFNSTVKILKRFPNTSTLLDIGCGSGLFLLNLSKYFPNMRLTGADISSDAINLAQLELLVWEKANLAKNVTFHLQTNPRSQLSVDSVDIILATMVCHHLSDDELVVFLQDSLMGSRLAVIINDLHRHSIAQWFYALVSPLIFRNRLITHDGLISIRRGFTRSDWRLILVKAGIKNYEIKWCFPFRWRVVLCKNSNYLKGI